MRNFQQLESIAMAASSHCKAAEIGDRRLQIAEKCRMPDAELKSDLCFLIFEDEDDDEDDF